MKVQNNNQMPILREDLVIISQKEIAPHIFEMKLSGNMVLEMIPGQFLHIRVPDASKLLRRPLSICHIDYIHKIVTIVYRVEGGGTKRLSHMKQGDLLDTMGSQGNGFDISVIGSGQKALIIGGGIGVPPLVEVAKQLSMKGIEVTSVLGFAHKDVVILEEEMSIYGNVHITTDDGSYGTKGYVSTIVDVLLTKEQYDAVYACGAPQMLSYIDKTFNNHPNAYLSMESRMACGMGACYACTIPVIGSNDTNKRVCKEGPVFKTGTISL